jgi:carbon monoxide dehydrogenase subunit G
MAQATVTRTINAPIDMVFKTISDINDFSKAVPGIVNVEIISDVKSGVVTRFRETRLMNGKEATTELEVTEFIENDRLRIVADSHGTRWDSLFVVTQTEGHTDLTLTMDAKAYKLMAKVMNSVMMGAIKKALEHDMDAVKTYCEKGR